MRDADGKWTWSGSSQAAPRQRLGYLPAVIAGAVLLAASSASALEIPEGQCLATGTSETVPQSQFDSSGQSGVCNTPDYGLVTTYRIHETTPEQATEPELDENTDPLTYDGAFYTSVTDARLPSFSQAPALRYELTRTYSSAASHGGGVLGFGWKHSYEQYIEEPDTSEHHLGVSAAGTAPDCNGDVVVHRGHDTLRFHYLGLDSSLKAVFEPPPGSMFRLVASSGSYVLADDVEGVTWEFEKLAAGYDEVQLYELDGTPTTTLPGRAVDLGYYLKRISDGAGNRVELDWHIVPLTSQRSGVYVARLVAVTDTAGRVIHYNYVAPELDPLTMAKAGLASQHLRCVSLFADCATVTTEPGHHPLATFEIERSIPEHHGELVKVIDANGDAASYTYAPPPAKATAMLASADLEKSCDQSCGAAPFAPDTCWPRGEDDVCEDGAAECMKILSDETGRACRNYCSTWSGYLPNSQYCVNACPDGPMAYGVIQVPNWHIWPSATSVSSLQDPRLRQMKYNTCLQGMFRRSPFCSNVGTYTDCNVATDPVDAATADAQGLPWTWVVECFPPSAHQGNCIQQCEEKLGDYDTTTHALRYTYGTGYELAHNLLEVRDAAGRLVVRNRYGADVHDVAFDRVVEQWINVGEAESQLNGSGMAESHLTRSYVDMERFPGQGSTFVTPQVAYIDEVECPRVGSGYGPPVPGPIRPKLGVVTTSAYGEIETAYLDERYRVLRLVRFTREWVGTYAPSEHEEFDYDATGVRVGVRDALGVRTCSEYDSQRWLTMTTSLPAPGLAVTPAPQVTVFDHTSTTRTVVTDAAGDPQTTTTVRDGYGRVQRIEVTREGGNGPHVTTFEYSPSIMPTRMITRYDGTSVSFTPAAALPARIIAADGSMTELLGYDPYGASPTQVRLRDRDGNTLSELVRTFLPPFGDLDTEGRGDTNHHHSKTTYDRAGNPLTRTDWMGDGSAPTLTRWTYQHRKLESYKELDLDEWYGWGPTGNLSKKIVYQPQTQRMAVTCRHVGWDGRVLDVINPEGDAVHFIYDPNGRLSAVQKGYFGVPSAPTDWTWALPCSSTAAAHAPAFEQVSAFSRYPGGVIRSSTIAGVVTTYDIDGFGRVVGASDAVGRRMRRGFDSRGNIAWSAVYRASATPDFQRPSPGAGMDATLVSFEEFEYDLDGRVKLRRTWRLEDGAPLDTTYQYDDERQRIQTTNPDGSTEYATVDPLGRVIGVDLPNGAWERTKYDFVNDRITRRWSTNVSNEQDGVREQISELDPLGLVARITENGQTLFTEAHAIDGRTLRRQRRGHAEETLTYDGYGSLWRQTMPVTHEIEREDASCGAQTCTQWPTCTHWSFGPGGVLLTANKTTTYGVSMICESASNGGSGDLPSGGGGGEGSGCYPDMVEAKATCDAYKAQQIAAYQAGIPTAFQASVTATSTVSVGTSGNTASGTCAVVVSYPQPAGGTGAVCGACLSLHYPVCAVATATTAETDFDYDLDGRPWHIRQYQSTAVGGGQSVVSTTTHQYDGLGRLWRVTDPVQRTTTASYVPGTTLQNKEVTSAGTIHWTFYDAVARPYFRITEPAAGVAAQYATYRWFGYDEADHVNAASISAAALSGYSGWLPSAVNTTLAFDSLGMLKLDRNDLTEGEVTHEYDLASRRRSTRLRERELVRTYDELGRLEQVTVDHVPVATYQYGSGFGGPIAADYGDGTTDRWTYDPLGRPSRLEIRSNTGDVLAARDDIYGSAGIALLRRHTFNGHATIDGFGIDEDGRNVAENLGLANVTLPEGETNPAVVAPLLGAHGPGWRGYALDGADNRRAIRGEMGGTTRTMKVTVDPMNRYLTADVPLPVGGNTTVGFGWDVEDDTTSVPGNPFAQPGSPSGAVAIDFDALDHPVHMWAQDREVVYTYDAFGRRVIEENDGVPTYLVWDGGALLATSDDRHVEGQYTLRIVGEEDDTAIAQLPSGHPEELEILHQWEDGSTLAVTDGNGLLAGYRYTSFGEPIAEVGSMQSTRDLWKGARWNPVTGTYGMGAREFSPQWARFLSSDPIGQAGGLNVLGFARHHAEGRDPSGLEDTEEGGRTRANDGNPGATHPQPNSGVTSNGGGKGTPVESPSPTPSGSFVDELEIQAATQVIRAGLWASDGRFFRGSLVPLPVLGAEAAAIHEGASGWIDEIGGNPERAREHYLAAVGNGALMALDVVALVVTKNSVANSSALQAFRAWLQQFRREPDFTAFNQAFKQAGQIRNAEERLQFVRNIKPTMMEEGRTGITFEGPTEYATPAGGKALVWEGASNQALVHRPVEAGAPNGGLYRGNTAQLDQFKNLKRQIVAWGNLKDLLK